jgi:lipoprotein NlpI
LALADFDRAIQLNTENPVAYAYRAHSYSQLGEFDRAIADYDEEIRRNPQDKSALSGRCAAYSAKANYDYAIADCDRFVQLDPQSAGAYFARGMVYWQSRALSKSLADLDQAVRLEPKNPYPALWREIVARRDGQSSQLAEAATQLDMTKWPAPVINLFLGMTTTEQLLAAADDSNPKKRKRQVCEANFYAAEFALQRDSKEDAQRLFGLAAADCPKDFIARQVAIVELKGLSANP